MPRWIIYPYFPASSPMILLNLRAQSRTQALLANLLNIPHSSHNLGIDHPTHPSNQKPHPLRFHLFSIPSSTSPPYPIRHAFPESTNRTPPNRNQRHHSGSSVPVLRKYPSVQATLLARKSVKINISNAQNSSQRKGSRATLSRMGK